MALVVAGGIAVFVAVLVVVDQGEGVSVTLLHRLGDRPSAANRWGMPDYPEAEGRVAAGTQLRDTLSKIGGNKVDKSKRGSTLSAKLLKAGIKLRPAEWLALSSIAMVVLGTLLYVRFGSILGFIVGAGLGYIGTRVYLNRRITKRKAKFDSQLGPSVLAISNGVKAGFTFAQAIDLPIRRRLSPKRAGRSRCRA